MNEFLEEKIRASVAKLGNRCFCWFPGVGMCRWDRGTLDLYQS